MVVRWLCVLLMGWQGTLLGAAEEWRLLSETASPTVDGAVTHWRYQVRTPGGGGNVGVEVVRFDARKVRVRILDNPEEPYRRMNTMMETVKAVAGVNGGFFHPDNRPAGLLVTEGRVVARPERARLLSGAVVVEKGHLRLVRYGELPAADGLEEGIQAGPFLVDGMRAVTGLEATRRARRTVIATDGEHQFALVVTGPLTLAETAMLLVSLPIAGWEVKRALNLDGGSSTGLWVARPGAAAHYQPEWGRVRNFLALLPREEG